MRTELLLAFALLPALLQAQDRVTVKGRVVDEKGGAVEYVQIGIPKYQTGTISTVDGRFEIEVPCDTLEFFHVSYDQASFPVTGPAEDLVIVLHEQELPPAVSIGGDTKEKYLLRPGSGLLKGLGIVSIALQSENPLGREQGSVAQAKKPFLVKDIFLDVRSNNIPGCVASINIYRIEGKKESFINVLHKPIYFDVAVSNELQQFDIQPEETVLLEPGRYFFSFQIVGCDKQAMEEVLAMPEEERYTRGLTMDFHIYLKSSYLREAVLGKMEPLPINIGVAVKGLEFQ